MKFSYVKREQIREYMDKHNISYRDMATKLGAETHQNFYKWLNREEESFGERMIKAFVALVKKKR